MVLSLSYRRPPYVSSSRNSIESEDSGRDESINSSSSCPYGIPDALSFDRIISGGTCPVSVCRCIPAPSTHLLTIPQPVTTREFMDFLRYIEYDAENLQFYLWYQDYRKRFDALSAEEKALAPEWTAEQALAEKTSAEKEKLPRKVTSSAAEILKGTDFDPNAKFGAPEHPPNPFHTPPRTPSATPNDQGSEAPSTVGFSDDATTLRPGTVDHSKRAETAFTDAGTFQPCRWLSSLIQPVVD